MSDDTKNLRAETARDPRPGARGEPGKLKVVDLYGDGTTWRLFLGEYGVATWPSKAAEEDPRGYAEEVMRCILLAIEAPNGLGPRRPTATATGCYECGDKAAITICARHAKEREIGGDDYDGSTPIDLAGMAERFLRKPYGNIRTDLVDLLADVEAMAMLRERWQRGESPRYTKKGDPK